MLSNLVLKFKSHAAAIAAFFKRLVQRLSRLELYQKLDGIISKVRQFLQEKIPGKRERLMLYGAAGVVVVFLFIGIIVLISGNKGQAVPMKSGHERGVIPPEELFLPGEPDFIPGVLLERDRRSSWTEEDAAPYWEDPLKDGEEPWRELIENTIDEIMERVP